ncbi:haloacid dehalogenase [Burkholderia multivorans]|nr:haloacid dehalogenase [Burkholderia multivorans]
MPNYLSLAPCRGRGLRADAMLRRRIAIARGDRPAHAARGRPNACVTG